MSDILWSKNTLDRTDSAMWCLHHAGQDRVAKAEYAGHFCKRTITCSACVSSWRATSPSVFAKDHPLSYSLLPKTASRWFRWLAMASGSFRGRWFDIGKMGMAPRRQEPDGVAPIYNISLLPKKKMRNRPCLKCFWTKVYNIDEFMVLNVCFMSSWTKLFISSEFMD